jgi:hypothetical protein
MTPTPIIRKLWGLTKGKSWEPPNPRSQFVEKLIQGGWVKRVDGICGFERFKDSMLAWTDAGRAALSDGTGGDPSPPLNADAVPGMNPESPPNLSRDKSNG